MYLWSQEHQSDDKRAKDRFFTEGEQDMVRIVKPSDLSPSTCVHM